MAKAKITTVPKLFGNDFLSNTGLNVVFRGRSGEPYSRLANPIPEAQFGVQTRPTLEGTVNGSRLPFNFRIDARLEKAFNLKFGKNPSDNDRSLTIYFLTQNLLDTKNIINVYPFTGTANDDGYLSSSEGENVTDQAQRDQYTIKVNDPNNYSIPRRMRVGAILSF